jgi:pantoate--beta-alanine ligase
VRTFKNLREWRTRRKSIDSSLTIGFVPTMGALHQGHLELVKRSRSSNDITVVSIFVNPTQFNNPEDLAKYPQTLESDIRLLESVETDYLLLPEYSDLYVDNYRYRVTEQQFSQELCGKSRPGHFDGVLTVVLKLLNLVNPQRAYFGEKDYQQLHLVRGMVEAFFIPTEIVSVPTVREPAGLAMSSRNSRLSLVGKTLASRLHQILRQASTVSEAREGLRSEGFDVDYVEDVGNRRFAAAWLEDVRLIDNIEGPFGG